MKLIMSKINCFNNVRLQTNAPEWKINKAIAIISATYTRRMSVVNHLQIIEIYFEGWIQRLKSNFFKFTHTHTQTNKNQKSHQTGTYILKLSVCMVLGSSTLAKRFDSAFYIVEKRIVYITVECEIWLLQLTFMISLRSNIITI